MTNEQKVIRAKVGLLELAKQLGVRREQQAQRDGKGDHPLSPGELDSSRRAAQLRFTANTKVHEDVTR